MTSNAIAIIVAGVFIAWSLDRIADAINKIGRRNDQD